MKTFANRTDEELALLYAAGDNKAFDELLERNQQKKCSTIFSSWFMTTTCLTISSKIRSSK